MVVTEGNEPGPKRLKVSLKPCSSPHESDWQTPSDVCDFLTEGVWSDDLDEVLRGLRRFAQYFDDARNRSEKKRLLAGVDAFLVLFGCVKKHADHLDVQVAGFAAMASCALPGELGQRAVQYSLCVLRRFSFGESDELQRYVYTLISQFVKVPENQPAFMQNNGVSLLCRAMRVHKNIFPTLCDIVLVLVGKDPSRAAAFEEDGFLIYVAERLRGFREENDTFKAQKAVSVSEKVTSALFHRSPDKLSVALLFGTDSEGSEFEGEEEELEDSDCD